jgi:predicted O-methyltransferase YrrM
MTNFTQDWFSHNIENFKAIKGMLPVCNSILEIGCFEGRATCWMLEHMLANNGEIVCVDTFKGSEEHTDIILENMYERWKINVDQVRKKSQYVQPYKGTSYQMLGRLIAEQQEFDFIYVDGSHTAYDVMTDACMAWGLLKKGGIMLFDDYLWADMPGLLHRPKLGIDYFTTLFSEQNQLVLMGYQLGLRKL